MTEREQLKAEIFAEIMAELDKKSNKRIPSLEAVRKNWFFGPDPKFRYSESKMQQAVGYRNQHVVWEAVRTLTRLIFGKNPYTRLISCDQGRVEEVANSICEMVYRFAIEERELNEILAKGTSNSFATAEQEVG